MTEGERLMRLETKIDEQGKSNLSRFDSLERSIRDIGEKMDGVMERKADRSELATVNGRIWGLLTGLLIVAITTIVGIMERH